MSLSDTDQRSGGSRAARKPPGARPWLATQLLARRVHFLAGILVAPFLLVVSLTGLIFAFTPQIHDNLYHSTLHVGPHSGAPHPMTDQIRVALTAHPEDTLQSVITPPDPDRTTRVVLSEPGGADVQRTVYVNPYTDHITGDMITVDNRLPANTWLRKLHSNLQLGTAGRWYAELSASWLPLIAVGGVLIWLAQPRRRMRVRELFLPSVRGKKGWSWLRAVHGPVGLWLTAGLLAISITGLAMSQFAGGRSDQSVDPIHLRAPTLTTAPVPVPPNAEPIGIDRAVTIAHHEGLTGDLLVTPPAAPDRPVTVAEMYDGGHDSVAIDPYTAQVTERVSWGDYSLPAKLTALVVQFHTGSLFGLANEIILALIAVGTIVLITLGYRMWWIHNPYRGRWPTLSHTVWRQLTPLPLILSLLGIAALARVLPLFGASLLSFVVLDGILVAIKRRPHHPKAS
ncbi:MAG TPA: PepSY domain-containing protein [Amycolatopsis sp.]|nr:PepSY domain-containing protein [Amycolatopsis sp.]